MFSFFFFLMIRRPPRSTRTDTLFPTRRSSDLSRRCASSGLSTQTRLDRSPGSGTRSEEHTSELQSLMRISYAVFCLKKKKTKQLSTYIIETMNTSSKINRELIYNLVVKISLEYHKLSRSVQTHKLLYTV